MRLNDSRICPNISFYAFKCELYRDLEELTWAFKLDNNNIDTNESSCSRWNTDSNYSYTFFTNLDHINSTLIQICVTTDYRLTAVVTRDMGQKRDCTDPYYASILTVHPLTSDRIPFSVSCSADSMLTNIITRTTHHGFIGKFNSVLRHIIYTQQARTAFYINYYYISSKDQNISDPQDLNCMITPINSRYIRVNASWSSPKNAESAAPAFYHVVLFMNTSLENFLQLAEVIFIATNSQQNVSDIFELPPQIQTIQYNISISLRAENKCRKMSKEVIAYCNYYRSGSNNEHFIYSSTYIIILLCTLCTIL